MEDVLLSLEQRVWGHIGQKGSPDAAASFIPAWLVQGLKEVMKISIILNLVGHPRL